jgi:NDP-sugar pyrophosphorylase family protein
MIPPGASLPSAVILAGGLATRLLPLTETVPKSLLDVGGEPFIAHQLRLLRARGVDHVVLCVGHLGGMIQDAVGDGSRFGVRVDYSFDGPRLLGTAGAVKRALPLLADPFFTLYGDSYLDCDYRAVAETFQRSGALGLMTVFRNEGRWDTSNVEYDGGRVLAYDKIHRTERMRHIDWGLGVFSHAAFASVPDGEVYDLASVYQRVLAAGELAAFEVDRRFYEIGSLAGIAEMRTLHHARALRESSPDALTLDFTKAEVE